MTDYELPGRFYLGRPYDVETGQLRNAGPVLYESRDLTTHAVCVGMTGSGKTGLCLALLEEAAIDGIPAICIDPKGDLGNLMLTFPDLLPRDFQPWIDPEEAKRKNLSPEAYAQVVADTWSKGLASWGQSGDRIRMLREKAEVAIYTPASAAGRQITVLRSFDAPAPATLENPEAFRERVLSAVSGLLALLQINADPISSRDHILLCNIFEQQWRAGQNIDMAGLIRSIQEPPLKTVGVLDLESFYPRADRFKLATQLNNLLASPGFAAWLEGEPLDIQRLLTTRDGRPRIAILSIAHLSDQERMFFVTIVLNELVTWMRTQSGTSSLRALFYMDEVFGYFPPTANPPSKLPMLTLLKQARAFGLGCVLATQNPVDLDYKGLSNCGTWFLGRLQTERDKLRVVDGLEGAATSSGTAFDRQQVMQVLSALTGRVFLMNNVHEDEPVVFQSRWALSYLRGPMTRSQIETLMAPLKALDPPAAFSGRTASATRSASLTRDAERSAANSASPVPAPDVRLAQSAPDPSAASGSTAPAASRPVLPPEIQESFLPATGITDGLVYRPALLAQARIHFVDTKSGIDLWDPVTLVRLLGESLPDDPWGKADEWNEDDLPPLLSQPQTASASWRPVPSELLLKKTATKLKDTLKSHLYRDRRLTLLACDELKQVSRPDESEADFRARLRHMAREERDSEIEKLRRSYATRLSRLEDKVRRAEQRIQREEAEKSSRTLSAVVNVGASMLGALLGRKRMSVSNVSRVGTAARSVTGVSAQSADVRHAREQREAVTREYEELNQQLQQEIDDVTQRYDIEGMKLTTVQVSPRKADTSIDQISLMWLPYSVDSSGRLERAF